MLLHPVSEFLNRFAKERRSSCVAALHEVVRVFLERVAVWTPRVGFRVPLGKFSSRCTPAQNLLFCVPGVVYPRLSFEGGPESGEIDEVERRSLDAVGAFIGQIRPQ